MVPTPTEAKAIAAAAYIFVAPLVQNYTTMYREAIDPSSSSYSGGFGHWLHRPIATTQESDLAASNATALHSSAWLNLQSEPSVFAMPAVDPGLSHTSQATDLWGFVLAEMQDGGASRVLLASPTWMGEVRDDVDEVVRGESAFVRCEVWTRMREPGDLSEVRAIQRHFVIEPLSARLGAVSPAPGPAVQWWPYPRGPLDDEEFWSVANFVLTLTTPNPQDRAVLERIAEIGVGPGLRWDAAMFSDDVVEAIGEGIDAAITELMRASSTAEPAEPHRSREDTDRDYFGRALAALASGATAAARPG